jgi:hypothetical protein
MGIKDVKEIVEFEIQENFQRENRLALEIQRSQNADLLQKRAEIRSQMRAWWERVMGIGNVEADEVGEDHRDLIFLRMAKWWVMEEGTGEKSNINRDRLSDWIRIVPKGLYVFENARFEEKAWEKAQEIFKAGLNRLDGNTIGLWKIYFKDNLEATLYNFGDVIDFKLKRLEKELELDEQLPVSLKQKMLFRIKEILTIQMAKLLNEKCEGVNDDNFPKIRQIIEGVLNNGISIGVILKFLEQADDEFPNGQPKQKIVNSIIRWMKEILLNNNNINAVFITAHQLMRFKMINRDDLQKILRESLEKRIKLLAEKVCIRLNGPEDLKRLEKMSDNILMLYHQNINRKNLLTREEFGEKDLQENYKMWRRQFDQLMEVAELIGLMKSEEGCDEMG